jgi:lipopolysaccharide/colanic/teichoic acid biosynthesis glycosyltransferase
MKTALIKNVEVESFELEDIKGYNGIYNKYIKRMFDVSLALIFLMILLPVYLIISLFIIIETGFPVIYKAERGGYNGKNLHEDKFYTGHYEAKTA